MSRAPRAAPDARPPARWLALAFALSATPVLPELLRQTAARPESLHVWLAPLLAASEAWRRRSEARPPRPVSGGVLVLLCFAAMVLGVLAGSPTLAWLGLSLGCVSLALFAGWPTPAAMAPLLGWAPLPLFVVLACSPGLEAAWARVLTRALQAMGLTLVAVGSEVSRADGAHIEFFGVDDGLVLAHGLAMLGLWHASRSGAPLARRLARVAAVAAAGVAAQALVLTAALVRLERVDAHAGRSVLQHGPPYVVLACWAALLLAARLGRHTRAAGGGGAQ